VSTTFCILGSHANYQIYADGTVAPGDSYSQAPQIWSNVCQDAVNPFCVGVGDADAVVGR
jgi:hypothetical protein